MPRNIPRLLTTLFAAAAISTFGCLGPMGEESYFISFLNQSPPEIKGGQWLNVDTPVRLADLKGKVVWLEFGFLG